MVATACRRPSPSRRKPSRVLTYANADEAESDFLERFSDGLPVVAPTEERVAAFLRAAGVHAAETPLGEVPPRGTPATVADLAVNAVMAALPPAAFAIATATLRAALMPAFNLNGIQSTTHSATPMIVVSGPAARRAGMNAAANALGQGNRANLALARTLRLAMTNLGGGVPGMTDMSVQGGPAKIAFAFAERDDAGGVWEGLAVRQGAPPGATTVTLMAAESPHVVSDHRSADAARLADNVADVMRALGSMNACRPCGMALIVAPQHARVFAAGGWDAARVAHELFARARNPLRRLRLAGEWDEQRTREVAAAYGDPHDDATAVPVFPSPDALIVTVAGSDSGGFSSVVPGWAASLPVHRLVEEVP